MATPVDFGRFEDGTGVNYWTLDRALQFEVERTYPDDAMDWGRPRLADWGETVGSTIAENADTVDDHPPELHTYDRDGNVVNEVEYHPAQFETERLVCEAGTVADAFHAPPGRDDPMPHHHSAAMELLLNYADTGMDCPVTMWAGAASVFEKFGDGDFRAEYEALTARDYENLQQSAMFLTEKQGGSDVGANETTATATDREGVYELTGEKWFCSNIDAPIKLVLARRPEAPEGIRGLSLFVVPNERADGTPNDCRYRRLKDKLGTKSVPTGEVVFEGAEAHLVGETERGYPNMSEMVTRSRLSVTLMGLGIVGRTLLESKIHAANREAFGDTLDEKPLMREDLVDMAVDYEAALATAFDAAQYYDAWQQSGSQRHRDPEHDAFRRLHLLQAVVKYRATALGTDAASYGVEIQGGNGVVDGFVTERLYRDAQVHPIWEGTSNVMALDVLRAMDKERSHEILLDDVADRLAGVEHDAMTPLRSEVRDAYESVRAAATRLVEADRETAEADAKRFADRFYAVYAAALLLHEAQTAIDRDDDARKAVVAERFVDRHLRGTDRDIGAAGERLAQRHFDAVVRFDAVDPASLVDRVAAD